METETQAIVLRRFDYSETSQVGHVLTATQGRLSVLAKGIKRPNATLKGPMDLFQLARVRYRVPRGSDLAVLTRYEPLSGFRFLRRRLEPLFAAFYVAELVYEGTRENDAVPEVFTLLARALGALEDASGDAVGSVVVAFELGFLKVSGFRLAIDRCARCGAAAGEGAFLALHGGLVCERCHPSGAASRLRPDTRALLLALERAGPRHADRIRTTPRQRVELRQLLRAYLQAVLERPLASEPFVADARRAHLRARRGSTAAPVHPAPR